MTRGMARFVRRENIAHAALREAVHRAGRGLIDADLGGGLIKQRVARGGQGRSGGYRTIIAYRRAHRAICLYGFAKNERANIGPEELIELRKIGSNWLAVSDSEIDAAVDRDVLQEVVNGEEDPESA